MFINPVAPVITMPAEGEDRDKLAVAELTVFLNCIAAV
jgi:hypothetical protein